MAGVILETISNKKLIGFGLFLLICQIAGFLLGGLIEAKPSHVVSILGSQCWRNPNNDLIFTRPGNGNCHRENSNDFNLVLEHVVYVFQMPLPRDNIELRMSRWFQYMVGVIHIDWNSQEGKVLKANPEITLNVKLGHKDQKTNWTVDAGSIEKRTLSCIQDKDTYECDIIPLYEIGSVHHDFYLLNLQLSNFSMPIPQDIYLHVILQTGGFTRVWFSLKTITFPCIIALLVFFWQRVRKLSRPSNLLEKIIFGMGITLAVLDCPIEWLTLVVKIPFMLLLSDIRQGIFYSALLSFWIVFCGEHMMDKVIRNRISVYWKELSAVGIGSVCLFIFEICERGVQLSNPFFSIWADHTGKKVALAFIIIAGISACIYFLLLLVFVFKAVKNINAKKSILPGMNKKRKNYFKGLIYRFNFLILSTLVFAAMTIIFFIISQVKEGNWKWVSFSWHASKNEDAPDDEYSTDLDERPPLEYTSAFFTGVFCMWNIYVGSLLFLYAPSKKSVHLPDDELSDDRGEEIEFNQLTSEATALAPCSRDNNGQTSFLSTLQKSSLD